MNLAIIILVVALVGFAVAYVVVRGVRRKGPERRGDIPLGMRPGNSDEELEGPALQRAMAWAVSFAVFAALFLPLYWLIEPDRINRRVDDFYQHDVEAGREIFASACASCHGANLEGGAAPHPAPDIDAAWPAPSLDNIVARYEDSEIVTDVVEFMELTIVHGRPGTPMPAFSVGQGGRYSDQQIRSIIAYILSVQTGELPEAESFVGASEEEVFAANCATCHGREAEGYVGPQLLNVYERYGWDPDDPASLERARAAVRRTIEEGRLVAGVAPMPAFGDTLTDDAIDAIIDHLESTQVTGGPAFAQVGGDPTTTEED